MNHELYLFGSVVRGEVHASSDVDMLVLQSDRASRSSYPPGWSVYHPETIEQYFREGRLFAWHLHLEAKCIYSESPVNFLTQLGQPAPYVEAKRDVADLTQLLKQSLDALRAGSDSEIYELGICYTALRDIAMSASWHFLGMPNFSRRAPQMLPLRVPIGDELFDYVMAARHASIRGQDVEPPNVGIISSVLAAPLLKWADDLYKEL